MPQTVKNHDVHLPYSCHDVRRYGAAVGNIDQAAILRVETIPERKLGAMRNR